MNTRPEALIGTQIDQYRLQAHIARGGMADVYLAHDSMLNRQAAIKILLPSLLADEQFAARFLREAQTAARLDHPNIVQIFGIGTTADGRPYLAMQLIEGGSLQESIDQLRARGELVDSKQALAIIGKMAEALSLAHAAGIVHRDIKPSNILIRPDGSPVLVDLGIAAVQGGSKLTHTGTLIGTPHYMSPEQAGGKKLDGRSDIYSLGVILYELLTGRTPFESTDPMAVLHCQIYEQPDPIETLRPDLSVETRQLVAMCMQKDPGSRFQNTAALRQAVNAALRAEGGSGLVNDAGVWQPYPSSEYRLSPSKIARGFQRPTAGSLDPRAWPKWLAAAAVAALLGLALFSFKAFTGSPAAEAAVGEGQPAGAAIAVQPSETPTAAASSTGTFVPLPTFTPTATSAATDTATPTATPAATDTATHTPVPSATSTRAATPTETRRPQPTPCGIAVPSSLSGRYNSDPAGLGCPLAPASSTDMAVEDFQYGRMFWRKSNDRIYVLYNTGRWASYADIWLETDLEFACGVQESPPTPKRGFGKIWCANNAVRQGLGAATNAEWADAGTFQDFSGGLIVRIGNGPSYILYNGGSWR